MTHLPIHAIRVLAISAIVAGFALTAAPARSITPGLPANCTGCSFGGRDLRGADLSGVSYTGADFARTDLRDANLRGARLTGASFRDADLRGANFDGAELIGISLRGAKLAGARFGGSNLTGVDLRGVIDGSSDVDARGLLHSCTGCDLQDAVLNGRDLSGIAIVGADLKDARARGTNFRGSDIRGMDVANADLRDANLRDVRLCTSGNGFQTNRYPDGIDCGDFSNANVRGADFRGALICAQNQPDRRTTCKPVDAATLRLHSRSKLDGATLP
jgi:uncharacterized protein YjbI with pentapeptide repeats